MGCTILVKIKIIRLANGVFLSKILDSIVFNLGKNKKFVVLLNAKSRMYLFYVESKKIKVGLLYNRLNFFFDF